MNGASRMNRTPMRILIDILLLPLATLLALLKYGFHLQLVRVRSRRIGPFGGVDIFLRRQKLGLIPAAIHYIGLATKKVVNQQLLTMYKRVLPIVPLPQPTQLRIVMQYLATRSLLSRLGLFPELKFNGNEFYELNNTPPNLSFTRAEKIHGQELLNRMKITSWFICIHARDSAYADQLLQKRDHRHDFRNCDINNYLLAAEYITKQGGFAVRMGARVEKRISNRNPQIIDYASTYRSDFGDIYLPANCKFFLGTTAGLNTVPYIFNIPCAMANVIPITRCPPPGRKDLFIPKKVWSRQENRFLTFREMITSPAILAWQHSHFKEEDDLVPIENTLQEILDLASEMNERLNGTWKAEPEDEERQQRFKALFHSDPHSNGFPSRLGAKFLRENVALLD